MPDVKTSKQGLILLAHLLSTKTLAKIMVISTSALYKIMHKIESLLLKEAGRFFYSGYSLMYIFNDVLLYCTCTYKYVIWGKRK